MWGSTYRDGQVGAFTLVELLVTIGIIGILAGLILTAMVKQKDQASRAVCINNLRQQTLTARIHATDNEDRLPWSNWLAGDAASRPCGRCSSGCGCR